MTWHNLPATTYQGHRSKPLVIALHGFGQSVRYPVPWFRKRPGWRYWNFAAMSGIVEECRRRNWSLWMPQAKNRNWKASNTDGAAMVAAARQAVHSSSRRFILGFSDGATVVNRLMGDHMGCAGFVSYSGMDVDAEWTMPRQNVMIAWNVEEPARIRRQVSDFVARVPKSANLKLLPVESDRHAWERTANDRIFGWLEGVA